MSELKRGWRFVSACCVGVICSSIVLPYYSIGTLVEPVTSTFGWTRAEFQAAILFSSGLGALTAPAVGWLIDRYGVRRVGIPGLVGLAAGFCIAASMDGSLWMLYLAYGAMALLGAGTIPVTWTQAIANQFFSQRGLALGLALTGTGICAVIAPHYSLALLEAFGWRGAYLGLALLPVVVALPLVFLWLRPFEQPHDPEPHLAPDNGITFTEALRSYRFWVLLATIFLAYMGFSGIGPNLFPSLTDDGHAPGEAATVVSVFGGAIVVGRVVVGFLLDRFWAPGVAAAALTLPVAGAYVLAGSPDIPAAVLSAFCLGFAAGAELDLMSFLVARYFGLKHYGRIYSVAYATLAVCSGTAPMLFAQVYDRTQSYDSAYLIAAVLFLASAVLILALGRYPADFGAKTSSTLPGS